MKWFAVLMACVWITTFGCADDSGDGGTDGDTDADTDADGDTDTDTDTDVDADTDADGDGSPGCGEDPTGIATSLDVGGEQRTFVLYLPDGYDQDVAYPLIFAWHGLGGYGGLAQMYFGIQAQVGADAIIVYPDALMLDSYGATGWELSPTGYDFDFFDAMYDHILNNLCIDPNRVFSTGHSFGGYMSNSLGCYRGDVLNAIAPVAGGPPWGSCDGPVAAWITHGSADDTVELSEGLATVQKWQNVNGCDSSSAATDPSPCVAYDGCTRDVHWCEHTGGHDWPGFAGAAIWDFFQAQ